MQENNNPILHFLGCFWDVKICHLIFLILKINKYKIWWEYFLWVLFVGGHTMNKQGFKLSTSCQKYLMRWLWTRYTMSCCVPYVSSSSKMMMHKFFKKMKWCSRSRSKKLCKESTHERDLWIDMAFNGYPHHGVCGQSEMLKIQNICKTLRI